MRSSFIQLQNRKQKENTLKNNNNNKKSDMQLSFHLEIVIVLFIVNRFLDLGLYLMWHACCTAFVFIVKITLHCCHQRFSICFFCMNSRMYCTKWSNFRLQNILDDFSSNCHAHVRMAICAQNLEIHFVQYTFDLHETV